MRRPCVLIGHTHVLSYDYQSECVDVYTNLSIEVL